MSALSIKFGDLAKTCHKHVIWNSLRRRQCGISPANLGDRTAIFLNRRACLINDGREPKKPSMVIAKYINQGVNNPRETINQNSSSQTQNYQVTVDGKENNDPTFMIIIQTMQNTFHLQPALICFTYTGK